GTQKSIINGMIKAADAGADVISMSLGGLSNQSKERAYRKAVEYANEKGAIVVAAAGNANRNAKNYVPAAVDGVISVSAIDADLRKAVFSNYVTDLKRGVAAPGVGIYSTIPGDRYDTYNGTSMATPYVAGLLGLMKSYRPGLTTDQAYNILQKTGKGTQQTKQTGKLIQPAKALKQLLSSSGE
ncbi:MAG: S8 family serine peptidase, partial [Phaeodactylibacter sp.]|nr:S8 family serine peptidase [Phaeodactylibacter sp.]